MKKALTLFFWAICTICFFQPDVIALEPTQEGMVKTLEVIRETTNFMIRDGKKKGGCYNFKIERIK